MEGQHQDNAAPRCKFLEIPAELRNRIYRDTLLSTGPTIIAKIPDVGCWIDKKQQYLKTTSEAVAQQRLEPPLLKTCRQIRQEATSIYYGEKAFLAENTEALRGFLATIGRQRRAMLRVVARVSMKSTVDSSTFGIFTCMDLALTRLDLSMPEGALHLTVRKSDDTLAWMNWEKLRAAIREMEKAEGGEEMSIE